MTRVVIILTTPRLYNFGCNKCCLQRSSLRGHSSNAPHCPSSSPGAGCQHDSLLWLAAAEYKAAHKVSVFEKVNVDIDGAINSGEKAGEVAEAF